MRLCTEPDLLGEEEGTPLAAVFHVLRFRDGSMSLVPRGSLVNWFDAPVNGRLTIGRCSGIGSDATIRYSADDDLLEVGRFVSIGSRLRVVLQGRHEIRMAATSVLGAYNAKLRNPPQPGPVGPIRIGNDVWVGDDVTLLSGATISDGCVIGAKSLVREGSITEPYGIYAGSPARIIRKRFDDAVIEELLALRWWEYDIDTLVQINDFFMIDLTEDPRSAVQAISRLREALESRRRRDVFTGTAIQ